MQCTAFTLDEFAPYHKNRLLMDRYSIGCPEICELTTTGHYSMQYTKPGNEVYLLR